MVLRKKGVSRRNSWEIYLDMNYVEGFVLEQDIREVINGLLSFE